MWGHMSLGGPVKFPYGAFLTSTIGCPALHELQDGTWKWGYKFQEAQTCEPGLTVYELDSESCEWEKTHFQLLMHQGWVVFFPKHSRKQEIFIDGKKSNWHYWYLVELLELFMIVKSLFMLYSQNEGKEGNTKNSAPYSTQLPSIFRDIFKTQTHKVFISKLYLYIHMYGSMHLLAKLRKWCRRDRDRDEWMKNLKIGWASLYTLVGTVQKGELCFFLQPLSLECAFWVFVAFNVASQDFLKPTDHSSLTSRHPLPQREVCRFWMSLCCH